VLLLVNKDDLASEQQNPEVSDEEIEKFVKEHGFFAHFKCSAKTGHNIKQACNHLVMQIAENNKTEKIKEEENEKDAQEEKEQGAVSLGADASKPQQQSGGGCCG
jgi:predicted GTPase